jgi:hypothetical protein
MADEINFIKERVEDLGNKYQAFGYLAPEEFNREIKQAQMDEISEQRLRYEMGTISSDNLDSLKVSDNISVNSSGVMTKPSDYLFFDSAQYVTFYSDSKGEQKQTLVPIEAITTNEEAERLSSELKTPSRYFPICVLRDATIQFHPQTLGNVKLNYLKIPADPFWNYVTTSGQPVYAPTGGSQTNPNDGSNDSTNVVLPFQLIPSLIRRVCLQLGIQVRQADIVQIMEQQQQTNNI